MKVCIVVNSLLPALDYGGIERVVVWLARGLKELGHRPIFLAKVGSKLDFAEVLPLDITSPLDSQIPKDTNIVHIHGDIPPPESFHYCYTNHGNARTCQTFDKNTIFCSQSHARNHGGAEFVHLGLDPKEYGQPCFELGKKSSLIFLGKAAWRLKNVRGAIGVARAARKEIEILGGNRLNFKMGFRLTLDRHAHFHGMVGGEKKNALIRQSCGLVFPVRWHEPGATAVIESLYFGLPIFGTPYGCLPELVAPHVGVLSYSQNVLGQAASRATLYDRREIHHWWSENFTYNHMTRKYLTYYESILDGQSLHPAPLKSPPVRTKLLDWIS
jgi:glycosyltransferase involved in cell wall biosynthesis